MNDAFAPRSLVSVRKKKLVHVSAQLHGLFGFRRFERERDGSFGRFIGEGQAKNTVLAAGKDLFLNLGIGGSTDHLTSATDIVIKNSGGTPVKTLGTCDSGWPKDSDDAGVPTKSIDYQWSDISVDTYDASQAFIVTPAAVDFASNLATGWGTKPTTENWIYTWRLSISSADSDFVDAGLDHWLRLMAGIEATHFDVVNMRALLYNASRVLQQTKVPSTGPTLDTGNDKITCTYVFSDGQGDGDWSTFEMDVENLAGTVVLRSGGTNTTGTKGTGDEWTWEYAFSI